MTSPFDVRVSGQLAPVVEHARQAAVGPQHEVDEARELERAAQQRLYRANAAHTHSGGWLERRRTERAVTEAKAEHQVVAGAYETIRDKHAPVIERHQQLANQLERYREDRGVTWSDRYTADPTVIEKKLEALETWHDWATGQPTTQPDLVNSVTVLRGLAVDRGQDWEIREQYKELASELTDWAHDPAHRIRLPAPPRLQIDKPGLGLEIGF